MGNKAVENYSHSLEFVSECYKTRKMCDKTVNTYPSTIACFTECFMTKEMCDKSVNSCFLHLILFLVGMNLKTCVIKLFLKTFFLLVYGPNKYANQTMCDEAVDDSVATLKLISDRLVTSKMIKKLFGAF